MKDRLTSFDPQRFDRIQIRRFARGRVSEQYSDPAGNQERHRRCYPGNRDWHGTFDQARDRPDEANRNDHTHDGSHKADEERFQQELKSNLSSLSA